MTVGREPSGRGVLDTQAGTRRAPLAALATLLAGTVADVPIVARGLLDRFGSLSATLAATEAQILSVRGVTAAAVDRLQAVMAAHCCALQEELAGRDIIGSWQTFERYVLTQLRCSPVEQARALFLDRKNGLIVDELLATGTVDHVPLYPREIARKALEHHASAVILVHNHPSGDPTPSSADIAMTRSVATALTTIGVALHDHAIVGRNRVLSMRSAGHF